MSPSDAPSFNMMRCHWHCSGTLLLLAADGLRYNYKLDTVEQQAPGALSGLSADMLIDSGPDEQAAPDPDAPDGFAAFGSPVVTAMPGSSNGGDDASDALASAGNNDAAAQAAPDEPAWFGPDGGDDWAQDGPDLDFDSAAADAGAGPSHAGEAAPVDAVAGADADAPGPSRRSRRAQQDAAADADATEDELALAPLPTLDPNDTSHNKNKPFKMLIPKTPKCALLLTAPLFCLGIRVHAQLSSVSFAMPHCTSSCSCAPARACDVSLHCNAPAGSGRP